MASTTLVAFLFDCPIKARTVELLGSWDNFSKPYPLKRDRRRGPYVWAGCSTFDNIICDGDLANFAEKRSGALMMGGTYWYYYKVNDDEEHHNPMEPSTTVCPLLPGQRLNVLDVPMESRSRSSSTCSEVFTRNPEDKFLNPVPPKNLCAPQSPRLGDLCKETYTVPMCSIKSPRSAIHPSPGRPLSPLWERHARSVSTSPQPSTSSGFPDIKMLKECLGAGKKARSRDPRPEMKIGAPTLISTTAEDINIVPLPSVRTPASVSSLSAPATARLREFAPLRSNPFDPTKDFDFGFSRDSSSCEEVDNSRPHSHVGTKSANNLQGSPSRIRSNSAGTRRTKVFSNEPWISSPRLPRRSYTDSDALPVLDRSSSLQPPTLDQRPSSSHGCDTSSSLRESPLNKELPPLPRYLRPAPLFACSESTPSPELPIEQDEEEEAMAHESLYQFYNEKKSHFSTWTSDSTAFSIPISEEEIVHSPTFSSLTSDSEPASPRRFSGFYSHTDQETQESLLDAAGETNDPCSHFSLPEIPDSAPQLSLNVPSTASFGPSLFRLDIQHSEDAPRRQAACFGFSGFQGYSLPEDDSTSQATITKATTLGEPSIESQDRLSSVSQLDKLMNDFGYLGDSVV
ncbi:hypothetical protein EJ04DRAFT_488643 [Polyplosphaeria fusca]|uniref:Uncharacterized protein n=1 Tax=Polyplosphaeria fusca TaxID=682080 RepID=A0A9P4R0J3_9PLEO|nr:hypothetical protein EJ04DRAFT_488643 [Polyplosphaeria fusca]